jgi:hypothetical protein
MAKCPDCLKEITEIKKKWKYGKFDVEAYSCECGANFRSYKIDGNERFKLKKSKKGNLYNTA